jgi:hypothetical protein
MPKRSRKKPAPDFNQVARSIVDKATGVSKAVKPAPNKAKPPKPKKTKDVQDIERADSEGMAQPQGLPAKKKRPAKKAAKAKDPAAVSLGRKGGLKGGPARAATMTSEQRAESARKAAQARWAKKP